MITSWPEMWGESNHFPHGIRVSVFAPAHQRGRAAGIVSRPSPSLSANKITRERVARFSPNLADTLLD